MAKDRVDQAKMIDVRWEILKKKRKIIYDIIAKKHKIK